MTDWSAIAEEIYNLGDSPTSNHDSKLPYKSTIEPSVRAWRSNGQIGVHVDLSENGKNKNEMNYAVSPNLLPQKMLSNGLKVEKPKWNGLIVYDSGKILVTYGADYMIARNVSREMFRELVESFGKHIESVTSSKNSSK